MKKMLLAACVAAFSLSAAAQIAEKDDDFDDFVEIRISEDEDDFTEVDSTVVDEKESDDFLFSSAKVTLGGQEQAQMTDAERAHISKYTQSGYTIVEEDEEGAIILKKGKDFICINPWLSSEVIIDKADYIEFVDISGCGMGYGVYVQKGEEMTVFSQKGGIIIPKTKGKLIEAIINPFKHNENATCAYAIIKDDGEFYAVLSNGKRYELKMDACQIGVMSIFGIKGNSMYCFTPESMETPEYMCDIDDDILYEEGELLTTEGAVRFDYLGMKKYSNVTPAVLVRKGVDYYLYPGGKKVMVKKGSDIEVKLSQAQKAVFSGYFSPSRSLVECIKENNSE